jgi:hypothetical protein
MPDTEDINEGVRMSWESIDIILKEKKITLEIMFM